VSCKLPTLENVGGTIIEIESSEEISDETAEVIVDRLEYFSTNHEYVMYESHGNSIIVDGVGINDTASIKELVERDRMMKVVYAVSPQYYKNIREYLKSYITKPTKTRPYKKSSMIGLVNLGDEALIDSIISSPAFKTRFPDAGDHNYGVKLMEGKKALFIQDANSPFMDQSMFSNIEPQKDPKKVIEGALSLELKPEYADRIGNLTGNDSTYLLHLFHDEVYISKIIKPHITSPSFSMAGAFTTRDVMVHAVLWLSEDIDQDLKVKSLKGIPKK
jgi:hypothetical protein